MKGGSNGRTEQSEDTVGPRGTGSPHGPPRKSYVPTVQFGFFGPNHT